MTERGRKGASQNDCREIKRSSIKAWSIPEIFQNPSTNPALSQSRLDFEILFLLNATKSTSSCRRCARASARTRRSTFIVLNFIVTFGRTSVIKIRLIASSWSSSIVDSSHVEQQLMAILRENPRHSDIGDILKRRTPYVRDIVTVVCTLLHRFSFLSERTSSEHGQKWPIVKLRGLTIQLGSMKIGGESFASLLIYSTVTRSPHFSRLRASLRRKLDLAREIRANRANNLRRRAT